MIRLCEIDGRIDRMTSDSLHDIRDQRQLKIVIREMSVQWSWIETYTPKGFVAIRVFLCSQGQRIVVRFTGWSERDYAVLKPTINRFIEDRTLCFCKVA